VLGEKALELVKRERELGLLIFVIIITRSMGRVVRELV
jgi:hypothetical protein